MAPQIGWSQNRETYDHDNATVATPKKESWQPINKFTSPVGSTVAAPAPLINVLNGVSFYSMTSICTSEKVILLKLINSNNYPVQVAWQMSPESTVVLIEIPASTDFEGSCSNIGKDKNKDKLIIKMPEKSEMRKGEQYEYAIKHLTVTKK